MKWIIYNTFVLTKSGSRCSEFDILIFLNMFCTGFGLIDFTTRKRICFVKTQGFIFPWLSFLPIYEQCCLFWLCGNLVICYLDMHLYLIVYADFTRQDISIFSNNCSFIFLYSKMFQCFINYRFNFEE